MTKATNRTCRVKFMMEISMAWQRFMEVSLISVKTISGCTLRRECQTKPMIMPSTYSIGVHGYDDVYALLSESVGSAGDLLEYFL